MKRLAVWFAVIAIGALAVAFHFVNNIGIPAPPDAARHRAAWMEENLATLGPRKLSQLTLPASHDAAMYFGGFLGWGRTQCLPIYDQLADGIRWFDLRPEWTGEKFRIHHGSVAGPDFSEVLGDIKKFASEGHRELVLLKLSHFANISPEIYARLATEITNALGPWLVRPPLNGRRLADITFADYVRSGPKVLVLVDEDYAINHPVPGLWIYADWNSSRAPQADLRVYDIYSNVTDFNTMTNDQLAKFDRFDGKCSDQKNDCDLFLLSWTLTPQLKIWAVSQPALNNLQSGLASRPVTNRFGKPMNMIYVDFVEFARVTDVAIAQNQRLNGDAQKPH